MKKLLTPKLCGPLKAAPNERRVRFHMHLSQRMKSPPPFGGGVFLHQDGREQKQQQRAKLLVGQLDGKCQRNHWHLPLTMLAALPTVEVGICNAPLPGAALGLPRMALSDSAVDLAFPSLGLRRGYFNRTLSRVVARQLGLLTQVRYPARGSARVTPMKHNLKSASPTTLYKTPKEMQTPPVSGVPRLLD